MSQAVEQIAAYLDQQAPAMLAFLRDLVQIESHASQPDGINAVGERVCDKLRGLGFQHERTRGGPVAEDERWLEPLMLPELVAPAHRRAPARRTVDGPD